ncbi:unnamed protein product [Prorocentrum cordatum]|uniref:Uncharacterized protein n=1 Tax=Prorocentrum cordatum TaxID=2364126 RepID=A0ABN9V039_9DINO|nr:unnamed protein product [Polarella glacialis]
MRLQKPREPFRSASRSCGANHWDRGMFFQAGNANPELLLGCPLNGQGSAELLLSCPLEHRKSALLLANWPGSAAGDPGSVGEQRHMYMYALRGLACTNVGCTYVAGL